MISKPNAFYDLLTLFAITLLVLSGQAFAQVGGLMVVVVSGADNSPLAGATVTLNSDRGLIAPTVLLTDTKGSAEFPVVHSGPGYTIEVSLPGFATRRVTDLRVHSGTFERVVVALFTVIQERVEVSARSNVVELDSTGNRSKFDDVFIENLPVPGRFYQNILSLSPGILDADSDGNPNAHGARARDFRAEVGGISNTDPLTGEWLSFINSSSIEEMEILGPGAGVEFGRASGGFASIIQKQGSNDFEGLVSFIYRSSDLDGDGATSLSSSRLPEYVWVQPGLQLSGAIVKDRLWYRLSHEYIRHEDPVDFLDSVEIIRRTQTINDDQLTWQISPRNKLAFQFQYDPYEYENYDIAAGITPESTRYMERGGPTYRLTWTAPQSVRLLFESKVAYQDHYHRLLPTTAGVWNGCVHFRMFPALEGARCLNADTGMITGSHNEIWRDSRQRLTLRSQATYYAGSLFGMTHRFKFGFVVENERFYRELDRKAFINFYTALGTIGAVQEEEEEPMIVGYATANISVPRTSTSRATGVNWAFYAEDQFHPVDNLAITLGLRFDRMEIDSRGWRSFDPKAEADAFYRMLDRGYPSWQITPQVFTAFAEINSFSQELATALGASPSLVQVNPIALQSAFWQKLREAEDISITNTDISPRLSVAWDPLGNGKMKLAMSIGRYYDKIFLAVPLLEMEPQTTNLTILAWQPNPGDPFREWYRPAGFSPAVSAQIVDRDLRTPYQDEFSLSLEKALWPETSIRLTYLKRKYRDQLQDIGINHRIGDEGYCFQAISLGLPTVIPSDGHGQLLYDPYNEESYYDTDPGPGDGRIDDCMGDIRRSGLHSGADIEVPDGLPDLYVLNPGWGELLMVGNFNSTEYTAYVLELIRRQYRNWQMNASYTWSKAVGSAEDFDQLLGNERTLLEDEYGYLSYDQRHAIKLSAISLTPWGFRFGGTVRWESGLPFSRLVSKMTALAVPPDYGYGDQNMRYRLRYPTGQRNDQRNPSYWTFDLRTVKEFNLARVNAQVTVEVFNLLNDDTLRVEQRINSVNSVVRRNGRRYQLGLRLSF